MSSKSAANTGYKQEYVLGDSDPASEGNSVLDGEVGNPIKRGSGQRNNDVEGSADEKTKYVALVYVHDFDFIKTYGWS